MVLLALVAVGDLPIGAPPEVPLFVIVAGIALAVADAAVLLGLFLRRRWAVWVALAVLALSGLMGAMGASFADGLWVRLATGVTIVLVAVTIALIVAPSSRRALS